MKKWTQSKIEQGFERFYEENGHYPSVTEMTGCDYLPSGKTGQRLYGGIEKMRTVLSLKHDCPSHCSGKVRSRVALDRYNKSTEYEEEYYQYLTSFIPELYVHEHKRLRCGKYRTDTDFFIYNKDGKTGIAIDLFYAKDRDSLRGQLEIKNKKNKGITYKTYLVCVNEEITQELIEDVISTRQKPMEDNIQVMTLKGFNRQLVLKLT